MVYTCFVGGEDQIFLFAHHIPFIVCRHRGPLIPQDSKLGGPLHQYWLYKLTYNISLTFIHRAVSMRRQKQKN